MTLSTLLPAFAPWLLLYAVYVTLWALVAHQDARRAEAKVERFERRDAEESARDAAIWRNVQRRLDAKPSRVVISLPDVVSDSEAATELLHLLVGPLEIEAPE